MPRRVKVRNDSFSTYPSASPAVAPLNFLERACPSAVHINARQIIGNPLLVSHAMIHRRIGNNFSAVSDSLKDLHICVLQAPHRPFYAKQQYNAPPPEHGAAKSGLFFLYWPLDVVSILPVLCQNLQKHERLPL